MPIAYEEVVKTVVFYAIDTPDDGLMYRLEALKSARGFRGEIYRLDTFSLKCAFNEFTPDESIYVLDTHSHAVVELVDKYFDSAQNCIDYVAKRLEENFTIE